MITKEQAVSLTGNESLHYGECQRIVGPKGGIKFVCEKWRVSGKTKTWKRDTNRFQVPIKFGLYRSSYLTLFNNNQFHLAQDCPIEDMRYT